METTAKLIVAVMACFALAGALDAALFKNRLGLGDGFARGVRVVGELMLSMLGILALIPFLTKLFSFTLIPLFSAIGLDPSVAAGSLIAIDMGGYPLASNVCNDSLIGTWSGMVIGSTLGAAVIFTLPVGFAAVSHNRRDAFIKGIICGFAASPAGLLAGGIMLSMPFSALIVNMLPCAALSAAIIIMLIKKPDGTVRFFSGFAACVNALAYIGLGLMIVRELIVLPLFPSIADSVPFSLIAPAADGLITCGNIGLVLAGAFPFLTCVTRLMKKPLKALGRVTGYSENALTGFLMSSINNIAVFDMLGSMTEREALMNSAFTVCAAFALGDHLAYMAANLPAAILPVITAKFLSGICAVMAAKLLFRIK